MSAMLLHARRTPAATFWVRHNSGGFSWRALSAQICSMRVAAWVVTGFLEYHSMLWVSLKQLRRCLVVVRAGCLKRHRDILRFCATAATAVNQPAHYCPGFRRIQRHTSHACACQADASGRVTEPPRFCWFFLVRAPAPETQHACGRRGCGSLAGWSGHLLCEFEAAQWVFGNFACRSPG